MEGDFEISGGLPPMVCFKYHAVFGKQDSIRFQPSPWIATKIAFPKISLKRGEQAQSRFVRLFCRLPLIYEIVVVCWGSGMLISVSCRLPNIPELGVSKIWCFVWETAKLWMSCQKEYILGPPRSSGRGSLPFPHTCNRSTWHSSQSCDYALVRYSLFALYGHFLIGDAWNISHCFESASRMKLTVSSGASTDRLTVLIVYLIWVCRKVWKLEIKPRDSACWSSLESRKSSQSVSE